MKKLLAIVVLGLLVSNITFAKKNKNTWDYPLLVYSGWVIKGSENHYKFQSNLREDKDVLKEFKNKKKIEKIGYNLIVIHECMVRKGSYKKTLLKKIKEYA